MTLRCLLLSFSRCSLCREGGSLLREAGKERRILATLTEVSRDSVPGWNREAWTQQWLPGPAQGLEVPLRSVAFRCEMMSVLFR